MPNHFTHSALVRAFFGDYIANRFSFVDKELDSTAQTTGPTHRGDKVHSIEWIRYRAPAYYRGVELDGNFEGFVAVACAVAKLHLETDKLPITYRESEAATNMVRNLAFAREHQQQQEHQRQHQQVRPLPGMDIVRDMLRQWRINSSGLR